MLVFSLKDGPEASGLAFKFREMNLRFADGKFQGERVYVFMLDGLHHLSYKKILQLISPHSPIDISRIAMNFHECRRVARNIA